LAKRSSSSENSVSFGVMIVTHAGLLVVKTVEVFQVLDQDRAHFAP